MAKAKSRNFVHSTQGYVKYARSKFPIDHSHKTMFNMGQLIPLDVQEIYPGDSIKEFTTHVIRTTAPFIRPVMDNLFIDMYAFFVPNRLVFDKWEELMGENKQGPWAETTTPSAPMVILTSDKPVIENSIADYMGLPTQSVAAGIDWAINELPFRAYALIWNEWFRNENVEYPVHFTTSTNNNGFFNGEPWSTTNILGMPAPVNKFKDYFTAGLPEPQKGEAVDIPIRINNFNLPVAPLAQNIPTSLLNQQIRVSDRTSGEPLANNFILGVDGTGDSTLGLEEGVPFAKEKDIYFTNLFAQANNDLVKQAFDIGTIRDLTYANQLQILLEKDMYGTRYVEYLYNHFGCVSQDARLQRPEFLGGKRMPIQIQQVQQTSQSTAQSPLAQVSAYCLSGGRCGFSKGFVEHGFVIWVGCVRQHHTYQQGIERFWTRQNRLDYYDPVFANIGFQPIYESELYVGQNSKAQRSVFAYTEPWQDLRFRFSRISGSLRSTTNNGFDIWHFGDKYANPPTLNEQFVEETTSYVDRTLAVPSTTAPQFVLDLFFSGSIIRVLPTYGKPGLIDHHI